MQEQKIMIAGGSLYYVKHGNHMEITRFNGLAGEVEVPAMIEELPVEVIGKKAFLSKKNLQKIILPKTIKEIGDWAFSYCDHLTEIVLPCRDIYFGRTVFMGCPNLQKINFPGAGEQLPALLAAAVTAFEAYYLLDLKEAGRIAAEYSAAEKENSDKMHPGGQDYESEWLTKWDARLLSLLGTPDSDGYSKQVLCGEEDYGSTDYEAFLNGKRKGKVRLAFLRLLHPMGLRRDVKIELETYLREHTKGCDSEETWQVALSEHGEDRAYYSLFAKLLCITEDNFQDIISDIGEEYTEMKAYFMRWKEENMGYTDFFAGLEL